MGLPSQERVWQHVVRLPRAVAVVLLGQRGVLFVRRYRFIQERWGWELPGGLVDEGGEAREAAVRELEEQTGYRAGELEHLMTFQPVPGAMDAERVVLVGRNPQRVGEPVRSEGIDGVEWHPLDIGCWPAGCRADLGCRLGRGTALPRTGPSDE